MQGNKLLQAGLIGTVLTALRCFKPILLWALVQLAWRLPRPGWM